MNDAAGEHVVDYWHYAPFFWRAEQDGELVLQVGAADHVLAGMVCDVRLLAHPAMLADGWGCRRGSRRRWSGMGGRGGWRGGARWPG